jgi:hypothetical protein
MAFRQPTAAPPRQLSVENPVQPEPGTLPTSEYNNGIEQSQEWVLFSPLHDDSTTRTHTTTTTTTQRTAGLSRLSNIDSFDTAVRSGRVESSVLEDEGPEDKELDSLDDGLQAFREPSIYRIPSSQGPGAVLPTHDGLGTFPASSPPVQEQLWQHEQYNPKRKFEGSHTRRSSVQRRLDTIEELESQASNEKRLRIEKWRMEQSQALLEEIEKQTRRRVRTDSSRSETHSTPRSVAKETSRTASKSFDQDEGSEAEKENTESEPFWRRITRKFIRDVIGIDEPILSIILGESLPPEAYEPPSSKSALYTIPEQTVNDMESTFGDEGWRDRLLQRIARELGELVNQLSPHPGAFSAYLSASNIDEYAGIPIARPEPEMLVESVDEVKMSKVSSFTPTFSPTMQDPTHAASWGLDEDATPSASSAAPTAEQERLRREREYWERELGVKMIFRFLKNRFSSGATAKQPAPPFPSSTPAQESARRAAIIRQHHPLVARAHQSPARLRRESRTLVRRASSCASESVKSSRRPSLARSNGSSRNYWDLGGSMGSGSIIASGGMWGEV